jgi:transposase-like protein
MPVASGDGYKAYAQELSKRCRQHLKPTNKSYRVDETYIKVKGKEKYLYRAVDSTGQTIDFLLTAKRNAAAARRFFHKIFSCSANPVPRVINVDKNPANPAAIRVLKQQGPLPPRVRLRQCKFLNNVVEIVFTQMTKAGGFGAGMGRNHISDLNLIVEHQDSIHQQFHENPFLREAGIG